MPAATSYITLSVPRCRVAVVAGGVSAEREVSLASGAAVAAALVHGGHAVVTLDPRESSVEAFDWSRVDLAFLALHGTAGEDGQIQQRLDELGVVYTGSGPAASRRAFHKRIAKERFTALRMPTPEFQPVSPDADEERIAALAGTLGYPLAVKPDAQGSSLGVSIVQNPGGLPAAVARARAFDANLLLERAIAGSEWTVPVLDEVALPAIRITTPHPFFDYTAKYEDERTRYDVIIDAGDAVAATAQWLSAAACRALGCRGMSRVDLRVDAAGQPWLLEVNTIPGLTAHSLVPKSAAAVGWSMTQLCEAMIGSALGAAGAFGRAA